MRGLFELMESTTPRILVMARRLVGYCRQYFGCRETANFQRFLAQMRISKLKNTLVETPMEDFYSFEVDNPDVWSKPWAGEYSWRPSNGCFIKACHEGNYALGNSRGARQLERDFTPRLARNLLQARLIISPAWRGYSKRSPS